MRFALGFIFALLAQTLTFIQLQGQFKWEWFRQHPYIVAGVMGFPISLLYLQSVKHLVAHFDGQLWPSRLIGFSVGALVFTLMSWFWFSEPLAPKTLVCLGLALCIVLIQLFW